MSGTLFLGLAALFCVALFFNGLRLARATSNPLAGKQLFGLPVQGSTRSIAQVRRTGLFFMVAAPLFLIVVTALVFGLLGPVGGITPITL
jgi:hypothetical protein